MKAFNGTSFLGVLRRLTRFRLRALLGFATLVAILLAAIVVPERRRRELVTHFEGLNAAIVTMRSVPDWLRIPGDEPGFREIVAIDLSRYARSPEKRASHWDCFLDSEPFSETDIYYLYFASGGPCYARRPIAPEELTPLADCLRCVMLNLEETPVDDDTMRVIGNLRLLQFLSLVGSKVTDFELAAITHLNRLENLKLSGPHVTDASVPSLAKLKSLRFLQLVGTGISESGIAELRQALPELEVHVGDKGHDPDGSVASDGP